MKILLFILNLIFAHTVSAKQLDTILIKSAFLGRNISIQIYDSSPTSTKNNIIYILDGAKFTNSGGLDTLEKLTHQKMIVPAYYVLVSTIDETTKIDYRNDYFFCETDYNDFIAEELIPEIESTVKKDFLPINRALVGFSFGAMQAAYFASQRESIAHIGLCSPITYPCPRLHQAILFSANINLNVFISTGQYDAANYVQPLCAIYKNKQYTVHLLETDGGHDFYNWNKQWEIMLNFFNKKDTSAD